MSAEQPPSYYFPNINFNSSFYETDIIGLTQIQANALYLRKTTPDTATALETFAVGIQAPTVNSLTSSSGLFIAQTQISGILNIGNADSKTGGALVNLNNGSNNASTTNINSGFAATGIVNILSGNSNTGMINLATGSGFSGVNIGSGTTAGAIAIGNTSNATTIAGTVNIGSTGLTTNINNGTTTTGTVNIMTGLTSTGTINLATGSGSATVNIGSGTTTGAIAIGNSANVVSFGAPLALTYAPSLITGTTQLGYKIIGSSLAPASMPGSTITNFWSAQLTPGIWLLQGNVKYATPGVFAQAYISVTALGTDNDAAVIVAAVPNTIIQVSRIVVVASGTPTWYFTGGTGAATTVTNVVFNVYRIA